MRIIALGVACLLALTGCTVQPSGPSVAEQTEAAVRQAKEFHVDRIPIVKLKFMKEEKFSLNIENEWEAEHAELPVGFSTYNEWEVGKELSRSGMAANILLKGEIAEYVVSVDDQWIENHWLYVDGQGNSHEIAEEAYKAALQRLPANQLKSMETSNSVITYVLSQSVDQLKFTSVKPLMRYFATVEISNESFTLDLDEHLRDAFSKHQISLEVPESVYNGGEAWEPHTSTFTFLTNGRLKSVHGKIVERHTAIDNKFVQATTADGRTLVLPASEVK